jgi:hypothetical protein
VAPRSVDQSPLSVVEPAHSMSSGFSFLAKLRSKPSSRPAVALRKFDKP